jgi:class 3 adenylate cyclase/tetratricopeptide (TPR) repeat protein
MITCGGCGAANRPGRRYCAQCGSALELRCPSCSAATEPGDRFCGECGTPLAAGAPSAAPAPAAPAAPVSERRLVSVLFADLVGFTTLSEHRDPEEVRDLLSRYFDRSRLLIERYGGTVEKFIGDAVMAVWGTPVAREDDAERSVRAALALTHAITALGEEVGMPELRVRAGVLTGSAAVEVGAEGEGMVLGDTVNTASRLQSIAAPGTVLVDDVTRRASESAIAYEDAGVHEVKGREQPVHAYTALRVVAGTGGARRRAGLEAPFVGRDTELQAIIDAGEESASESRARQVAVVGEAGAGKSRLLWEYFKYIDGIVDVRWWHQGRCLSYGEGVAYWALAEMVRARAGILEEEPPSSAREKLRAAVEAHVPDERERRLVEPRLAHLLRLEDRPDADRADLFSGWRLFFERMAATDPVVLVFEDLHWADSGLLDFIDYLLDWSAEFPIFVLALGRPELRERRPSWDPLVLAPLPPLAIATILDGLAPGLPPDLVADIGRRADGIPLYAVETIRMLQDRGLLVQEGSRYVVTGDVSDLDVPETLHALVASRLDGLSTGERSLLQDASVLGQSFTAAGAAALSGRTEADVAGVLDGLVAKQVLGRDDDPRSPERGQYVFLQALLRTVAYGTLSRRARKARHVAAAAHLQKTWPGEAADIAEVLAAHYLEAIRADPEADDAAALRATARETLTAAGRAAASLALGTEAQRYFEHAAELADDDLERAALFEQAGRALFQSGDAEAAEERLRRAVELYERNGRTSGGMAAEALAGVLKHVGRIDEARVLLERFIAADDPGIDDIVRAQARAQLGGVLAFAGAADEAGPLFEEALTTLELAQAWPALAMALVNRAIYLIYRHRLQEGTGVLRQALALAERHDLPTVALRARFNLAAESLERDRLEDAIAEVEEGLAAARERGDRVWERAFLSQMLEPLVGLGRWDDAAAVGAAVLAGALNDLDSSTVAGFLPAVAAGRGDEELFERCREIAAANRESTYVDQRVCAALVFARDALERGATDEVIRLGRGVFDESMTAGECRTEAYALSVEAALASGDDAAIAELEALVAALPPARATPRMSACRVRLAAEQAQRRGDVEAADRLEREAIAMLRSVGARPLLARALLDRARRRDDPEALAEARAIYADLGATRYLAQLEQPSRAVA